MKRKKKRKIQRTLFFIVIEIFIIALVIFFIEIDKENDRFSAVVSEMQNLKRFIL